MTSCVQVPRRAAQLGPASWPGHVGSSFPLQCCSPCCARACSSLILPPLWGLLATPQPSPWEQLSGGVRIPTLVQLSWIAAPTDHCEQDPCRERSDLRFLTWRERSSAHVTGWLCKWTKQLLRRRSAGWQPVSPVVAGPAAAQTLRQKVPWTHTHQTHCPNGGWNHGPNQEPRVP